MEAKKRGRPRKEAPEKPAWRRILPLQLYIKIDYASHPRAHSLLYSSKDDGALVIADALEHYLSTSSNRFADIAACKTLAHEAIEFKANVEIKTAALAIEQRLIVQEPINKAPAIQQPDPPAYTKKVEPEQTVTATATEQVNPHMQAHNTPVVISKYVLEKMNKVAPN